MAISSMQIKKRKCKECRKPFTPSGMVLVCSFDCAVAYGKKTAAKAEARKAKEVKAKERKQKSDFRKTDTKWLKANAEFYCNKYIRLRDAGNGCISCGTHNPNIVYAAGHFIPKGRCLPLRYNELNIHLQCNEYCNRRLSGNLIAYEAALRIKIGDKAVDWLKGPHKPVRYRAEDYIREIEEYKAKIKLLGK